VSGPLGWSRQARGSAFRALLLFAAQVCVVGLACFLHRRAFRPVAILAERVTEMNESRLHCCLISNQQGGEGGTGVSGSGNGAVVDKHSPECRPRRSEQTRRCPCPIPYTHTISCSFIPSRAYTAFEQRPTQRERIAGARGTGFAAALSQPLCIVFGSYIVSSSTQHSNSHATAPEPRPAQLGLRHLVLCP